jgi:phage shock protein A
MPIEEKQSTRTLCTSVPKQKGRFLMIHIAVRVRELVASNVDTLVSKAGDRRKMLRLLQSEIEESLVSLHGDLARGRRAAERQVKTIETMKEEAEGWTGKAKIAVDHGREDLARSALLAREGCRRRVCEAEADAAALSETIAEWEKAIGALEAKRIDLKDRIADLDRASGIARSAPAAQDSPVARRLDRIDALERRASYEDGPESAVTSAAIEAEIAELERASAIEAELAAMKSAGAPQSPPSKKRAARKA